MKLVKCYLCGADLTNAVRVLGDLESVVIIHSRQHRHEVLDACRHFIESLARDGNKEAAALIKNLELTDDASGYIKTLSQA